MRFFREHVAKEMRVARVIKLKRFNGLELERLQFSSTVWLNRFLHPSPRGWSPPRDGHIPTPSLGFNTREQV